MRISLCASQSTSATHAHSVQSKQSLSGNINWFWKPLHTTFLYRTRYKSCYFTQVLHGNDQTWIISLMTRTQVTMYTYTDCDSDSSHHVHLLWLGLKSPCTLTVTRTQVTMYTDCDSDSSHHVHWLWLGLKSPCTLTVTRTQVTMSGMQLPNQKKRGNIRRHNASAERGSQNAKRHEAHNGTLENFEVYYALWCILS